MRKTVFAPPFLIACIVSLAVCAFVFFADGALVHSSVYGGISIAEASDGSDRQFGLGFAQVCPSESICFFNPIETDDLPTLIVAVINFILTTALILLPIVIVIGGLYLLTAAGDPGRVSTGKKILLWGVIGFVVLLFSRAIMDTVLGLLGVDIDLDT